MAATFLIIEDEEPLRRALARYVRDAGHVVWEAGDGERGLDTLAERAVDVAVVDLKLPGMSGLEVLRAVKEREPSVAVIMMTAYDEVPPAVAAMKEGAYDYLKKPFDPADLLRAAEKAAEAEALKQELSRLRDGQARRFKYLVPVSAAMRGVFDAVAQLAATPGRTPALIVGETGTGKEVIARELHARGERASRAFVTLNCAAVPEGLLESELFGYVRGAFTDARKDKRGLFEHADGGTLFLDEIGDMKPALQPKLLRALEEGTIRRVGAVEEVAVNARVVAATNHDLAAMAAAGSFRDDLYYRLNVFTIRIPPLRERPEDIIPLARYFVQLFNAEFKRPIAGISPAGEALLQTYSWPGNVRELRNVIERAVILTPGLLVPAAALGLGVGGATPAFASRDDSERRHILAVLAATGGNRAAAARVLKVSRTTLWAKLKRYHLAAAARP